MKKRLYFLTTIILSAAVLSFSSCLKDSRFVDLTKVGTIVEFPFGGQVFFNQQAITAPDTVVIQFAVNVASPTVPTTATPITLSVDDPTIISAFVTANPSIAYIPMPSNAYVFTETSATIPANQRSTAFTLTVYHNLLDPSKSYMLPIAIKSANGLNISGNQGVLYYHVIGNPFAGAYRQTFRRWNASDSTSAPLNGASFNAQPATISPVSPTEFQMFTGYDGGNVLRYDVTFSDVSASTFNQFSVSFVPSDVTGLAPAVTITNGPVFLTGGANTLTGTYTVFGGGTPPPLNFQFGAMTSAPRYLVDYFYK